MLTVVAAAQHNLSPKKNCSVALFVILLFNNAHYFFILSFHSHNMNGQQNNENDQSGRAVVRTNGGARASGNTANAFPANAVVLDTMSSISGLLRELNLGRAGNNATTGGTGADNGNALALMVPPSEANGRAATGGTTVGGNALALMVPPSEANGRAATGGGIGGNGAGYAWSGRHNTNTSNQPNAPASSSTTNNTAAYVNITRNNISNTSNISNNCGNVNTANNNSGNVNTTNNNITTNNNNIAAPAVPEQRNDAPPAVPVQEDHSEPVQNDRTETLSVPRATSHGGPCGHCLRRMKRGLPRCDHHTESTDLVEVKAEVAREN